MTKSTDINIVHYFKYENGDIEVELTAKTSRVTWYAGGEEYAIEDACGESADWSYLYQRKWRGLSGAALESCEKAFAKDYAIKAFEDWKKWVEEEPEILKQSLLTC